MITHDKKITQDDKIRRYHNMIKHDKKITQEDNT